MKKAKDKFSTQAKDYQKFRPGYPDSLYTYLYSLVPGFAAAWDCGTGNGQVAIRLAEKFEKVFATDISANQIKEAVLKNNIIYSLNEAGHTDFVVNSFDLITVAQAAHWFELDSFYNEVLRVAKPGALLVLWGYNLLRITPVIDKLIDAFYSNTLAKYWDPERKLVDDEYQSIEFPFNELPFPQYEKIIVSWNLDQLIGYFDSWSAVQNYIKEQGLNPVHSLAQQIAPLWDEEKKLVSFKIFGRIGYVEKFRSL